MCQSLLELTPLSVIIFFTHLPPHLPGSILVEFLKYQQTAQKCWISEQTREYMNYKHWLLQQLRGQYVLNSRASLFLDELTQVSNIKDLSRHCPRQAQRAKKHSGLFFSNTHKVLPTFSRMTGARGGDRVFEGCLMSLWPLLYQTQ